MRRTITLSCACMLLLAGGARAFAQRPASEAPRAMERVTGIGGFFFRAKDPKALAEWYERHLGINGPPTGPVGEPWRQEAGTTAFSPFKADTKYFGRDSQQWMINFRVRDLDAMVRQLEGAGIKVEVDPETYSMGRFARLEDPEGNPIQLWEPKQPKGE